MMRQSLQPNETYDCSDNTDPHDDNRQEISCPGRHFIENLQFHMNELVFRIVSPSVLGGKVVRRDLLNPLVRPPWLEL